MEIGETQITNGNFTEEKESCKAFDAALEQKGLFEVWKEVPGRYLFVTPEKTSRETARIDRILWPTQKLRDAGWTQGAIGIEIKRSGGKLGPYISQMMDYRRAAFKTPIGIDVILSYVFLFPCEQTHNEVAPIMAQNRIGTCAMEYPKSKWQRLGFSIGEQRVLNIYLRKNYVAVKNLNVGTRLGSR